MTTATIADFKTYGENDGQFMADVYLQMMKPYGDNGPPPAVAETYDAWATEVMWSCNARLRDEAGASEREINAWRRGLVAGFKRNTKRVLRAIKGTA